MLAPRVFQLLVLEHHQAAANAFARFVRQDHVVDEAARTGYKRVRKPRLVLRLFRGQLGRVTLVLTEDDLNSTLGTHHRNFGVRPGEVDIAAQVFG